MPPLKLESEEEIIAKNIRERLRLILELIDGPRRDEYSVNLLFECGDWARKLHLKLGQRDVGVRHHLYMLKNRGCNPTDFEFYRNIHAIQDLLKFLEDTDANNDPVDKTLDNEFSFDVFSRRWGHKDRYRVVRTTAGWDFSHIGELQKGDMKGSPGLYRLLDHDSVNYPEELPAYFEWLWEKAQEEGLPHDQVQQALADLAEWIGACETTSPAGVFSGLK